MKKNYIKIMIFLIICIIIMIVLLYNNKNKLQTVDDIITDITYEEDDIDWSSLKQSEINLDKSLDIIEAGVYTLTGKLEGNITINTEGYVKLILNGVTITNTDGPVINVINAKKTYIELNENTINILEDGGSNTELDGVIYSTDDLIIDGLGSLNVTANNKDGIVSKDDLTILNGKINITSKDDGIRGKDSVVIKDGTINITSAGDSIKTTNEVETDKGYILISGGLINIESDLDGILATSDIKITGGTINIKTGSGSSSVSTNKDWSIATSSTTTSSMKGIKAANNIIIEDGAIVIDSEDDAIHANNYVGIKDGIITITSGDDGIHADAEIIIDNGTIKISKSYEGIEAASITINNGNIYVVSSDDGFNVAGGNDDSSMNRPGSNTISSDSTYKLTINDGYIYVNATGDGLDSNGNIYMNGGTVIVEGPTDSGNGTLDYEGEFVITGGFLIASGSSGMAQAPTISSTQNSLMINFTSTKAANTAVNISNILTFVPSKSFSSIVVSSPYIKIGNSYTITLGGTSTGTKLNGLYDEGIYSGGTLYTTVTSSSVTTTVGSTSARR